jgi:hypothetical protein
MFHRLGDADDRWYGEVLKMVSVTDECCGCAGVAPYGDSARKKGVCPQQ